MGVLNVCRNPKGRGRDRGLPFSPTWKSTGTSNVTRGRAENAVDGGAEGEGAEEGPSLAVSGLRPGDRRASSAGLNNY
jgi:hypothetical protein